MYRRVVVRFALCAAGLLMAPGARAQLVAQSARPGDPEALIRKGNELRQQGRNEEALPLFQAAYAAERTPRTAGQLGLSEMTVGYWVEAEAHLAEALEFPNHPWVARNLGGLREMLTKARAKIAELVVEGGPMGAEVRVNGRLAGTLPLANPLRIGEGRVEVEVVAPNYESDTRSLSINGGEKQKVTFDLARVEPLPPTVIGQPAVAPAALAPSEPAPGIPPPTNARGGTPAIVSEPASQRSNWPALATGAAGLVAVGFGTVELIRWQHAQNSFNDHVGPSPGSPTTVTRHDCGEGDSMRGGPGCQSLFDDAVQARNLAIVGLAAGGALAVTSLVLWFSDRTGARARVACALQAGGRGAECRWHF